MLNSDDGALAHITSITRRMGPELRRQWVRRVLSSHDLTAAHKTVLVALETYADVYNGTNAHPGETNLAKDCGGITTRSVRAALARGRELGFIERTAVENPRAGLAAVYRLVFVESTTGTTVPVNEPTTGTPVPVNNSSTGTALPVNNPITGTYASPPPERTFLPPSPTPKLLGGLRNRGTSPAPCVPGAHKPRPSRFCDAHPQGTKESCPECGRAREAFKAWQSEQAAIDVAIAAAERQERERLRRNCPWCHGTNTLDVDADTAVICDHQTPPRGRRGLSLVPPLPDRETVRAAQ